MCLDGLFGHIMERVVMKKPKGHLRDRDRSEIGGLKRILRIQSFLRKAHIASLSLGRRRRGGGPLGEYERGRARLPAREDQRPTTIEFWCERGCRLVSGLKSEGR